MSMDDNLAIMSDPDEMQCVSCGGANPRCSAFHPEYGFTCIMPDPHSGPHYDPAGGHWTKQGQLWFEENEDAL